MRWTKHAELIKRLPSWLYKTASQLWIDRRWPRHLFIELTSDCNLSCPHCPRPALSREIPYELFKKVVDEASLHGHRSISLHLFGEPLLYSRLPEVLGYLKARGHTTLLTTNGVLLRRDYQKLKGVDKIIWSYKENIKVPEELKTWKNFTVRFFDKEDLSWPRRERKYLHNYGGSLKSIAHSTVTSRYPCYHPFLAPAVRSNGDMVICCADPLGKSVVGNVKNESVSELWKKMEVVRREHLNGKYNGICKDCDTWKVYPNMFFSWQYGTSPSSGDSIGIHTT